MDSVPKMDDCEFLCKLFESLEVARHLDTSRSKANPKACKNAYALQIKGIIRDYVRLLKENK